MREWAGSTCAHRSWSLYRSKFEAGNAPLWACCLNFLSYEAWDSWFQEAQDKTFRCCSSRVSQQCCIVHLSCREVSFESLHWNNPHQTASIWTLNCYPCGVAWLFLFLGQHHCAIASLRRLFLLVGPWIAQFLGLALRSLLLRYVVDVTFNSS